MAIPRTVATSTRSSSIGSPTDARLTGSSWVLSTSREGRSHSGRVRPCWRSTITATVGGMSAYATWPSGRTWGPHRSVGDFFFSPDGARLVSQYQLRVLDGSDLKEERSRPAAQAVVFLSNDELLIHEAGSLKGWDLRTGRETFTFAIPKGAGLRHSLRCGDCADRSSCWWTGRCSTSRDPLGRSDPVSRSPRLDDVASQEAI